MWVPMSKFRIVCVVSETRLRTFVLVFTRPQSFRKRPNRTIHTRDLCHSFCIFPIAEVARDESRFRWVRPNKCNFSDQLHATHSEKPCGDTASWSENWLGEKLGKAGRLTSNEDTGPAAAVRLACAWSSLACDTSQTPGVSGVCTMGDAVRLSLEVKLVSVEGGSGCILEYLP